ncbi:MAG: TIGR02281 family clan AA aspartic protease [Gammaproteobacteria bacterium]|nr:MAG: TIGR02281 family clan AA aspartic protease [Gammaproteobacteria bacterium]
MPDQEPAPQKKLGRGMLSIAWVLILGFLTYAAGYWEDKQLNPNSSPESSSNDTHVEVTLQRNRWGHYVTSGLINQNEVVFLLDTGASEVSIPEHIAQSLRLKKGPSMRRITANGEITVYATTLDQLDIGDIQLKNINASINPFSDDDVILLGMSVLTQVDFSQRGKQLTLRQMRPHSSP